MAGIFAVKDFVKGLAELLIAIVVVMFFGICAYGVYYMFRYAHVRSFGLWHTENLERFIVPYMTRFMEILKYLETYSGEQEYTDLKSLSARLLDGQNNFRGIDVRSKDISNYVPSSIPEIYCCFMYFDNLQEISRTIADQQLEAIVTKQEGNWASLRTFFDKSVSNTYFESASSNKVKIDAIKGLYELYSIFDTFRTTCFLISHKYLQDSRYMLAHELFQMLDSSNKKSAFYVLSKMYRDRKPSKIGEFSIIWDNMQEQSQAMKEKIPPIWKNTGANIEAVADKYYKFVASDKVFNVMLKLPLKIAGIENYEDSADNVFVDEHGNPVEGFFGAIIGMFKAIAKIIPMMFKILLAIVSSITNPPMFFRAVIGYIVGFFIFVVYIILIALQILFYIPASIVIIGKQLFQSAMWGVQWVFMFVFMFLVWILDTYVTKGALKSVVSCENLPSSWYLQHGYAKENINKRGFMVNKTCRKNFEPDGGLCRRMNKCEPVYCPQQLIYQFYKDNANLFTTNADWEKAVMPPAFKDKPMFCRFVPSIDYRKKSEDAQKEEIGEFYDMRNKYMSGCFKAYKDYDYLNKNVCQFLMENPDFKTNNKAAYDKMSKLCAESYCMYKYDQVNDMVRVNPIDTGFCAAIDKKSVDANDRPSEDAILMLCKSVITICILLIIALMIVKILNTNYTFKFPSIKLPDIDFSKLKRDPNKPGMFANMKKGFKDKIANMKEAAQKVKTKAKNIKDAAASKLPKGKKAAAARTNTSTATTAADPVPTSSQSPAPTPAPPTPIPVQPA